VLVSTDPTGGAATWKVTDIAGANDGSNTVNGVSCPSPALCVTSSSGAAGELVLTSTDPTGGAAAWSKASGAANNVPFEDIACPSTNLCVAEDPATDVIVSTDPTGGASAWKGAVDEGKPNHLGGSVSCPTTAFCALVGNDDVVTSTDP